MEPVTVVVMIVLFVLGGGGVTAAAGHSRRTRERLDVRDAIRQRVVLGENVEVSIFDVFWDLGVSDYALEIMGNQGLLIHNLRELPSSLDAIAESVKLHGSYSGFIRETLETIQEFYDEHRRAGHRRALPSLQTRQTKTLEIAAVGDAPPSLPVPSTGSYLPVVARSFDERLWARSGGAFAPLLTSVGGLDVDVDALTRVEPMRLVKSLLDGNIGSELGRWWEMRGVRALRDELDKILSSFYTFYVQAVQADPRFYSHLYDAANRWDLEARRIDELLEQESWRGKSWAVCARCLLEEARATSKQLSWLARNNVDQTIAQLHDHARRGDLAMAGYLVYLNHHAFFAGRAPQYSEHVRRIESCTYRLQEELRNLQTRGVV